MVPPLDIGVEVRHELIWRRERIQNNIRRCCQSLQHTAP